MAVSVGSDEDEAMSDINVVPLTDVMLVLLIIFIITVPVVIQQVPVTLPKVRYEPTVTKPENVVRWRWEAGDVAFWDNRATQHRAVADFALQRRTLRRATVHGDAPVGIDGRVSRTTRKEKAAEHEAA